MLKYPLNLYRLKRYLVIYFKYVGVGTCGNDGDSEGGDDSVYGDGESYDGDVCIPT